MKTIDKIKENIKINIINLQSRFTNILNTLEEKDKDYLKDILEQLEEINIEL